MSKESDLVNAFLESEGIDMRVGYLTHPTPEAIIISSLCKVVGELKHEVEELKKLSHHHAE